MSTETHQEEATGNGSVVRYYVDESGDPTLFDSKGRVLAGKEGCSRFFILGLLEVADPDALDQRLAELRSRLLSDPYFRGVPSMQPDARKTALAFHAKDDLPEVRREVFALLKEEDVRFFAVVCSKKATVAYVQRRNRIDPHYRYHPNELYDYLVRRLFRDRLHQSDQNLITFAARGKSDRTRALLKALEAARRRYSEKWGSSVGTSIEVASSLSRDQGGLQAVDYFLWAVQRLYERGEERFLHLIWPRCRLVHDVDDARAAKYGAYYNKKTPPSAATLTDHPGI
jgi:hypothetical protein